MKPGGREEINRGSKMGSHTRSVYRNRTLRPPSVKGLQAIPRDHTAHTTASLATKTAGYR